MDDRLHVKGSTLASTSLSPVDIEKTAKDSATTITKTFGQNVLGGNDKGMLELGAHLQNIAAAEGNCARILADLATLCADYGKASPLQKPEVLNKIHKYCLTTVSM